MSGVGGWERREKGRVFTRKAEGGGGDDFPGRCGAGKGERGKARENHTRIKEKGGDYLEADPGAEY